MVFKKLHLGTVAFSKEALDDLAVHLKASYETSDTKRASGKGPASPAILRRTMPTKIKEAILALALCHNVTPVVENGSNVYQASSPDEVQSIFQDKRKTFIYSIPT